MRGRVVRALGSTEEKADIIGPHKWPGFLGERKETLAYGRAAAASARANSGLTLHAAIGSMSVVSAGGARLRLSKCDGARLLVPLWRSEAPLRDQPFNDGRRVHPHLVLQTSAEQGKPAAIPARYRAGQ